MSASVRPSPLALLIAFFFLGHLGTAVCAAYATPVSPAFMLLFWVGTAWGFSWWVLTDCRERGVPTVIDYGWVVFYTWPIAVPYHVFSTRGVRGWKTLLGMVGGYLGSYLISLVVYWLLWLLAS